MTRACSPVADCFAPRGDYLVRMTVRHRHPLLVAFALGLTACAGGSGAPIPDVELASMSCSDLNKTLSETSKGVTASAISRGKITNANIPLWLPLTNRAADALKDRQTTRIEALRSKEYMIAAERSRRCR